MAQFIIINHPFSLNLDTILVTIIHGSTQDLGFLKKLVGKLYKFMDVPYSPSDSHIFSLEYTGEEIIWLPFQTRRGCSLNCSYCSTPLIEGNTTRKRSTDLIIDALSAYASAGFDHLFFVDNTFNLPPGFSKDLCDQMIEAGLNITWGWGLVVLGSDQGNILILSNLSYKNSWKLGLEWPYLAPN